MNSNQLLKRERHLLKPFEMYTETLESWGSSPEVYYFFEIVEIVEGSGSRYVNHTSYPYAPGCFFIFTPDDCRSFDIHSHTTFRIIRFTNLLFDYNEMQTGTADARQWLQKLSEIFYSTNRHGLPIIESGTTDSLFLHSVADTIETEFRNNSRFRNENIKHLITVLLNVITRNISVMNTAHDGDERIHTLMTYIHEHIYDQEKISMDHLSSVIHVSRTYLGEYFKKQTGVSVQDFITAYKMNLAKMKLSGSPMTITAIARELAFTDESHFSHAFKKNTSLTPGEYRSKNRFFQ